VARISLGKQANLELGSIEPKRDWGFAGDYVEAMWLMLQQDKPDDYVIATGENHSVKEFLDLAFQTVGIADWSKYVITNKSSHMRPAEVDYLIGDATKAREKLGWKPKTSFKQLVEMMVKADLALEGNKMYANCFGGWWSRILRSHLCKSLLSDSYKVVCVDNLLTSDENNISSLISNQNFSL